MPATMHSFPHPLTSTVYPLISSLLTPNTFLTLRSHTRVLSNKPRISSSRITPNPPLWTVSEVAEAVNGRIVKWGPPGPISTDTRTLEPGQWFFAITGQNFDAHHFITHELSAKGCVGVIGNWVCENWDKGFVEVEGNTVICLEKMGNYARKRFHGCLIGLTGSVSKTTRTMIGLALEGLGGPVHQSHGNWNNRIGVALSLIGIARNAEIVVLELGMSGEGEILELAMMCKPSIRVILNVGAAHLENFGSLEEVSMAKG